MSMWAAHQGRAAASSAWPNAAPRQHAGHPHHERRLALASSSSAPRSSRAMRRISSSSPASSTSACRPSS